MMDRVVVKPFGLAFQTRSIIWIEFTKLARFFSRQFLFNLELRLSHVCSMHIQASFLREPDARAAVTR